MSEYSHYMSTCCGADIHTIYENDLTHHKCRSCGSLTEVCGDKLTDELWLLRERHAEILRPAAQQQRTEAVIALAERLFLRHPGQYGEKVLCNYFNDARKFVDAADAYRKQQSTEGGADE